MPTPAEDARPAASLIVTFFGDCVVPRGAVVAASTVGQVIEACGIAPGAVRTALSRLAADGWIERERRGRRAFYRLSEDRRAEFQRAGQLIYAAHIEAPPARVVVPPPGAERPEGARYANGVWVTLHEPPKGSLVVTEPDRGWPVWLADDWPVDPATIAPRHAAPAQEPLAALVQRILLVHDWRRLVLRAHGRAWLDPAPLHAAHQRTCETYCALWPISERWLEKHGQAIGGPMPGPRYDWRFGYTLQELLEG